MKYQYKKKRIYTLYCYLYAGDNVSRGPWISANVMKINQNLCVVQFRLPV